MGSSSVPVAAATRIQQVRRDDVVRAAVTVIDRDGYQAASIVRIATEAGTSKGTVLYHFKSRAAVDEGVVAALFADGKAYMAERMRGVEGSRQLLVAYLTSNLGFVGERAAHVRAAHEILANRRGLSGGPGAVPWLTEFLGQGQRSGEFSGGFDPHVVALAIRAVIDGASYHLTEHPDLDVDHYTSEAVRLFDLATRPEEP